MQPALDWLSRNHEEIVRGLADLVTIQSISTDGEHHAEIDRTAKLTCDHDAIRRSAQRRGAQSRAAHCHTLMASGWKPMASRRSSCTPTTTCSRSTLSSSGRATRGS